MVSSQSRKYIYIYICMCAADLRFHLSVYRSVCYDFHIGILIIHDSAI